MKKIRQNSKNLIEVLENFTPITKKVSIKELEESNNQKYKNNTPLKELVKALKDKDEEKVCDIFKNHPNLINTSLSIEEHNLEMLKKEYLGVKKIYFEYKELYLTPLQYALFNKYQKVAAYAFTELPATVLKEAKPIVVSNERWQDSYSKRSTTKISPIDIVLLYDNLSLWNKIPQDKLLDMFNSKNGDLIKKVLERSTHVEDELFNRARINRCYPQKIYHELIKTIQTQDASKNKKMMTRTQNININYLQLAAHLQDISLLKTFMTNKNYANLIIDEIISDGQVNKICGPNGMDLNSVSIRKNALLTVFKAHYELYQELPASYIQYQGKKEIHYPILETFLHRLTINGIKPLIEEFIKYPEIQKQAQDFYKEKEHGGKIKISNYIKVHDGLNLLETIHNQWDKTEGKANYKAHEYLLEIKNELRDAGYYSDVERKKNKEKVKKFINYCYEKKNYLFIQKRKGVSLFDCLESLGLQDLKDEIKIKFEKKSLRQMVAKKPIMLKQLKVKML